MELSKCWERATNMSIPHWGLPPPMSGDMAGSFGKEEDGSCYPTDGSFNGANSPLSSFMNQPIEPAGFQYNNVTFRDVCGMSTAVVPADSANDTIRLASSAIVINVTSITNTNPQHGVSIQLASCDGAVAFNATTPGVFVLQGSASVAVFVERWYGANQNPIDGCPGQSFIAFTSATRDDYCKVDDSLAACKPAAPSATSSATSVRRTKSHCVAAVVAMMMALMAGASVQSL